LAKKYFVLKYFVRAVKPLKTRPAFDINPTYFDAGLLVIAQKMGFANLGD